MREARDLRLAVLVNDLDAVPIDPAMLASDGHAVEHRPARLVAVRNGSICCTLREDLLEEVARVAKAGRFDYLLVESPGDAEPTAVVETFTCRDEAGRPLPLPARLDTLVTVVDARSFMEHFAAVKSVGAVEPGTGAAGDAGVPELLAQQVELANVVVINKTDLVNATEVHELKEVLRQLNPEARLLYATHGRVPPGELLYQFWFDMGPASRMPGWLRTLRGGQIPESGVLHIRSFIYRSPGPFHPLRLARLTRHLSLRGVLRSKGFVWLASQPDVALLWSQAGRAFRLEPVGRWWAALPAKERPVGEPGGLVDGAWHPERCVRQQELVFIGKDMDEARLKAALDACLLSEKEKSLGEAGWRRLPDPFPVLCPMALLGVPGAVAPVGT
jgi:G3E family GTPase